MTSSGWNSFREASKHKAIAATAAEELERPAVSHRVSVPPADEPVLEVHETTPSTAPLLPEEEPPVTEPDEMSGPVADEPLPVEDRGDEPDPDELVAAAVALMTPAWPSAHAKSRLRPAMKTKIKTTFKHIAPWYGLAVVPVAGALSLIAMRAGLNPYALCLQWWDLLFGSIFFSAAALFIGISMWRGLQNAWMPAAPALGVLIVVTPLWLAANSAWGSGCGTTEVVAAPVVPAAAVPVLQPPVEVNSFWAVPMPQPRPPELDYRFRPEHLDLDIRGLALHPASL